MICPNCEHGKFPGMEIKHQGVIILVCARCHWKGEITHYDEALFGKWEADEAVFIFDEAAKWTPDDWRKWTGVDMGSTATPSYGRRPFDIREEIRKQWAEWVANDAVPGSPIPENPYVQYKAPHYKGVDIGGYHFNFNWSNEELELINKLREELWDEFRRRGGIRGR